MPRFADLPGLLEYLLENLQVGWLVSPVLAALGNALLAGLCGLVGIAWFVLSRRRGRRMRVQIVPAVVLLGLGAGLLGTSLARIQWAVGADIGGVVRLRPTRVEVVGVLGAGRPLPDRVLAGTRIEHLPELDGPALLKWLAGGGDRLVILSRLHFASLGPIDELYVEWEAGGSVVASRLERGPWRLPVVADTGPHHAEVLWESPLPGLGRAWAVPVAGGRRVEAADEEVRRVHRLRFDDLTPDTDYAYGVASQGSSRWGRFRTLPERDGQVLRLAVIGDSGGGEVVTPKLVRSMTAFRPHAVLHVGDLAYDRATRRNLRAQFYEPFHSLWREVPVRIAPGNHDIPAAGSDLAHFLGRAPYDREPILEVVDAAGIRAIGLNSNAPPVTPLERDRRVRAVLAEGDPWWRIAFFHHPPWSGGEKPGHPLLRRWLHPMMLEADVDLVFSGHSHNYQRTEALGADGRAEPGGTRYVVTGGGGGTLREVGGTDYESVSRSTFHHVEVVVEGPRLWLEARNVHGRSIDRLHLKRSSRESPPEELAWTDPPAIP